jgi:zinc transport system permease protein
MLDDFLVRAALAGLGTAITAGLLGCFVVWRRMAYFGDAMAHAAILGVALSLGFSVSIFIGVIVTAIAVAFLFLGLTGRGQSADAALGVIAHGGLALGLVAVALLPGQRISLDAYLFGDVLTVSCLDLAVIWGGALVVFVIIWHRWSALLTATLSPDLAHAAGIKPRREELILTLLLALVVAVAIKVVGALLITVLLIVPAAAARTAARTPEGMAVLATTIGAIASLGGLRIAMTLDTAVGPTIVCTAVGCFALMTLGSLLSKVA